MYVNLPQAGGPIITIKLYVRRVIHLEHAHTPSYYVLFSFAYEFIRMTKFLCAYRCTYY